MGFLHFSSCSAPFNGHVHAISHHFPSSSRLLQRRGGALRGGLRLAALHLRGARARRARPRGRGAGRLPTAGRHGHGGGHGLRRPAEPSAALRGERNVPPKGDPRRGAAGEERRLPRRELVSFACAVTSISRRCKKTSSIKR